MSYKVEVTSYFNKQAKRLLKKFPSLKKEITELFDSLETNPIQGDSIGNGYYKIRIAISSKGKGKSGGARMITHIQMVKKVVYVLSIYDKSEQENLTDKELQILINSIPK